MKKSIELVGVGTVLPLSKGTGLHIKKKLFHLDQLTDGSWRVTFTASLLPDGDDVLQGVSIAVKGKEAEASFQYNDGHDPLAMRITKLAPIVPRKDQPKDVPMPQMLHLEQMDDGNWRLLYSKSLVPDIKVLSQLKIQREPLSD